MVTVFCRKDNPRSEPTLYKGVNLVNLPTFKNRFVGLSANSALVTARSCFDDFDIMHYFGCGHVPMTLLGRLCGKSVVLTLDGLEWERLGYPRLARIALRSYAELAMVFPSQAVADSLSSQEWYHYHTGVRPTYIPYGADISTAIDEEILNKYGLANVKYVVFAGRIVYEKGVHTLIEAVNSTRADIQLVVIGGAPQTSNYMPALKGSAGPKVKFLGYVYGRDFETIRNASLIWVQPSLLEGTSIALLGAMGAGKCILASDLREIMDVAADSAEYFRRSDANDLKDKLESLLSDPTRIDELGRAALLRAKKLYSWDKVTDAYEKIYRQALAKESR